MFQPIDYGPTIAVCLDGTCRLHLPVYLEFRINPIVLNRYYTERITHPMYTSSIVIIFLSDNNTLLYCTRDHSIVSDTSYSSISNAIGWNHIARGVVIVRSMRLLYAGANSAFYPLSLIICELDCCQPCSGLGYSFHRTCCVCHTVYHRIRTGKLN